jgi:manganese-dependent inorganic pyrophosphatase
MAKPIYAIGHRNPDTDSICAAIGYAHLKQALGENVVAARAGKINAETKYALEHFRMEEPLLLPDLNPRVKDIMCTDYLSVGPETTLRELGKLMQCGNVKSVPVVVGDNQLAGILSVSDLAKLYFNELQMPDDLAESGVDYAAVQRVLDAKVLCGNELLNRTLAGRVRIASGTSTAVSRVIKAGDIVLTADRREAHLSCLDLKVGALVVTGDYAVDEEVLAKAKQQGVLVLQTAYDTYTSARLINQSTPVRAIMQAKVLSFKPTDLINDITGPIAATNYRNYPVVENGRLVGLVDRDKLIMPEPERVILVDHNETAQAVEGIEEAKILEIIDHHRLGGLTTSEPILIRQEPVGCTSTIVANMYWNLEVSIPKEVAGVLLSAIISDTVLFKSPTATAIDRRAAEKLAEIAGVSLEEYGMAMLKAGSGLQDMTPPEITQTDLKEFRMGDYRMTIAQLSVMDVSEVLALRQELLHSMEQTRAKGGYDMALLMITDILTEATHLAYVGQPVDLIERAFGSKGEEQVVYLPGVMSRKKQIVPPLTEAAKV